MEAAVTAQEMIGLSSGLEGGRLKDGTRAAAVGDAPGVRHRTSAGGGERGGKMSASAAACGPSRWTPLGARRSRVWRRATSPADDEQTGREELVKEVPKDAEVERRSGGPLCALSGAREHQVHSQADSEDGLFPTQKRESDSGGDMGEDDEDQEPFPTQERRSQLGSESERHIRVVDHSNSSIDSSSALAETARALYPFRNGIAPSPRENEEGRRRTRRRRKKKKKEKKKKRRQRESSEQYGRQRYPSTDAGLPQSPLPTAMDAVIPSGSANVK